jgi:hypothetical protein
MGEGMAFADYIRRIRADDDRAARMLVERYEPIIRREVRVRLRDPRLFSQFDWTDIATGALGVVSEIPREALGDVRSGSA